MAEYDAKVIRQHADNLYSKATSIVVLYTVSASLLCALIGYVADVMRARSGAAPDNTLLVVALIVGGIGGYMIGTQKAFFLKLQAQIALCQVKIEENTRLRP